MNHADYLLRCIALASNRIGFCAPNPAVGCVVVKDNTILAEGFHFGCGHPHAEVDALEKIGDAAIGSTVYVSLEPCCHYGRTPPCTDRLIQSGVERVYFGLLDPNPIVAGKGREKLIAAGILCEKITVEAIQAFYLPYVQWTQTRLPYAILKLAVSSDYKIALADGKPAEITGVECSELTHRYRNDSDAILTSVNTVINDNPKMNVRRNGHLIAKNIYVIDRNAALPLESIIFETAKSITLFYAEDLKSNSIAQLQHKNVRCIPISETKAGLDLKAIIKKIGEDGVHQVWIEVGDRLADAFLKSNVLNEMILYVSPKKLGENAMPSSVRIESLKSSFHHLETKKCGDDRVYRFFSLKSSS